MMEQKRSGEGQEGTFRMKKRRVIREKNAKISKEAYLACSANHPSFDTASASAIAIASVCFDELRKARIPLAISSSYFYAFIRCVNA